MFLLAVRLLLRYLTHIMSKRELEHLSTLALRQRKAHLLRTLTVPAEAIHASFPGTIP